MSGHGEKLPRKQAQAIVALLSSPTMAQAAEIAGVGVSTLIRWQKNPNFAEAYRTARREVVAQATGKLSQICAEAVGVLQDVMRNPQTPAASRVMAARSVIDYAFRAVEFEDLSARVEAIEESLM